MVILKRKGIELKSMNKSGQSLEYMILKFIFINMKNTS